jgi:hypothetical protein
MILALTTQELLTLVAAPVLAVLLVVVVRWRRQGFARHVVEVAEGEVCDHLRPALDLLRSRGHGVTRVGQKAPEMPLEIHMAPPFDPKGVYDELKLDEPVFVSERNVLYCKEDWCELHPKP